MRQKGKRILLITDLDIMPKLPGSKLVKKLRATRMDLRAFLFSETRMESKRNRWLRFTGASDELPPARGSLLARLRLAFFRSLTDTPSVISGEEFALLSLALLGRERIMSVRECFISGSERDNQHMQSHRMNVDWVISAGEGGGLDCRRQVWSN